jgi:extracellular factor (EF) 3-hydroxypalmitic acid methyl ester biosynthesis protein
MVNMIQRNGYEGGSLFAKIVNAWFLRQPPAQAHRNRINYLSDALSSESLPAQRQGRPAKIFSIACGPAHEVCKFLEDTPLSGQARFTLLDFNEETLQYARAALETAKNRHGSQAALEYMRKPVQQILKESARTARQGANHYDLVYCAGLLDYLPDPICQRLISIMYDWAAPGGLVLVTNVEPSNPLRHGMEHLLDWHLIYRTSDQLRRLVPAQAAADSATVRCDETGLNLFLEIRKQNHA